jgi:hypothetical protein
MEVIGFLRAKTGTKMIPVVRPQFEKTLPDRYVFQWDRRVLNQCVLNGVIRFLLHGAVIRAADGQAVHLTSQVLRYVLSFNYVLSLVLFFRFLVYFPSC